MQTFISLKALKTWSMKSFTVELNVRMIYVTSLMHVVIKITLKSVIYIMHYKMDIYIHPDDDGFISLWSNKSLLINKCESSSQRWFSHKIAFLRETETGRCASIKKHLNLRISHSSLREQHKLYLISVNFLYKCASGWEGKNAHSKRFQKQIKTIKSAIYIEIALILLRGRH